ncbi:MAG: oxidoreductase [Acidobacteriia bacterium]|nr:oxidoreductase [Terriglobia bacterium]
MRRSILLTALACLAVLSGLHLRGADATNQAKLIVLDPGHFHASLIQEDMYPSLAKQVSVYAPLGPDLLDYLQRIERFNTRKEKPTSWEIEVHAGPDFFARMLRERPGNLVIISGRNRPKIDRILASAEAGLNVLADKPWIISSADLPKVERALDEAQAKHLVAYDIMTERYEIASILQRELVDDANVFGKLIAGTDSEPGISAKSVHHLMKVVAGAPLRRPAWFFDVAETGEGLADVGTHVVDLVQWTAFPDKMDYRTDVHVLSGRHWPTIISQADFQRVTGEPEFPRFLAGRVKDGKFEYYCNNSVHYTVRGVHVKLDILWNWQAPEGTGDTYEAAFRGTKARVEIRQGKAEGYVPEVYVVPDSAQLQAEVFAALKRKVDALKGVYPGVAMAESGGEARVVIPKHLRSDREHFADVTNKFFEYLNSPQTVPEWEKTNMLVKYYVTTRGVEAAR